jgi:peptidoglycan-associated lipoprotein
MLGLLVALTLALAACGGPPDKALSEAEQAVEAARGRSSCAQEKFDAAEKLLAEARTLSEKGEYDEAERKAKSAAQLAREAEAEAEANWEECNRRKQVVEKARDEGDADTGGDGVQGGEADLPPAELKTVYFGYDSAELNSEQRARLDENARWFREHPETDVTLEGHTDERGSVEYNLALGERRARVAREYLMKLGIDGERMRVLSYGEEKPAAYGRSDEDYRKNRRVEFIPEDPEE